MMGTNGTAIELTAAEQRLVEALRQLETRSKGHPFVMTVYANGRTWQMWPGVPGGTVESSPPIDNGRRKE